MRKLLVVTLFIIFFLLLGDFIPLSFQPRIFAAAQGTQSPTVSSSVTVTSSNVTEPISFSQQSYSSSSNPSISGVNFQGSNGSYTITIYGNNFGPSPVSLPYTGDLDYFRIADASQLGHGEWGYTGDANYLTYQNWTNNEIVVSGFQGNPGDAIGIALWNPVTGLGATWGAMCRNLQHHILL